MINKMLPTRPGCLIMLAVGCSTTVVAVAVIIIIIIIILVIVNQTKQSLLIFS